MSHVPTPADYPLYRLRGSERNGFWVDVWLADVRPGSDPEDPYALPHTKQLACCLTRESAIAVLRLHGVTKIHDWTAKGANWRMPMTPVLALCSDTPKAEP